MTCLTACLILNNLKDLMLGVKNLLTDDGIFVIECNYWGGMVKNTNYSLIYHDHFSYFSIKPWISFAKKYKMFPFDAIVTPAQGGSLRLFLSKKKLKRTKRFSNLLSEEVKNKFLSQIPSGKIGYPKDIANTVIFLASEEAKYITGQTITVDGGRLIN